MTIREKLAKLIDVKSIITIALVIVLCITTLTGASTPDLFNSSVMLVLGFFFGKVKTADKGASESSDTDATAQ